MYGGVSSRPPVPQSLPVSEIPESREFFFFCGMSDPPLLRQNVFKAKSFLQRNESGKRCDGHKV